MVGSVAENLMVYQATGQEKSISVEDYAFLVKRIAHHMMARMPSSVQVDDLIQAGMIGLLEASQKYDGGKGASFETYAGIRIRGAIVDEMRRGDWAPRSVHRNSRRVSEAISQIEARTGRDAKDSEVAALLQVNMEEYYDMVKDAASTRLFSYDESYEDDDQQLSGGEGEVNQLSQPAEDVRRAAMQQALAAAIDKLPEREKLVLSLYYEQELNLKEIGQVLEVSESRVSQIHSQAAARLRSKLTDWQ
ncbi:RNA polymerase sigma factor FliA [Thalassocella blandensis]|nr:RNA polymerase sigma factor FliA [Thalassocella blandensis]